MVKRLLRGQMIIEVVVAFAVMIVALVAILRISGRSVNSSGYASRTSAASAYANEAMDWIRNQESQNGWGWLRSKCTPVEPSRTCSVKYCFNNLPADPNDWTGLPSSCPVGNFIGNTNFQRGIKLQILDGAPLQRNLQAVVTVYWSEANVDDQVLRETDFLENN